MIDRCQLWFMCFCFLMFFFFRFLVHDRESVNMTLFVTENYGRSFENVGQFVKDFYIHNSEVGYINWKYWIAAGLGEASKELYLDTDLDLIIRLHS